MTIYYTTDKKSKTLFVFFLEQVPKTRKKTQKIAVGGYWDSYFPRDSIIMTRRKYLKNTGSYRGAQMK